MYFVLLAFGWRGSDPATELVGASAGIFGVLVAATKIAPDAVGLVLGIVPMRLRVLTWVFVAYAVFQVLFRGSNAGGEAAHLGGALIGFLLMTFPRVLERIAWLGKRAPPF
jgi:membrane associated rhomboid family serine protease